MAFLELAQFAAGADGFVNRKEQGYLRSFMAEMDLVQEDAQQVPSGRELSEIISPVTDPVVRKIFLAELLLLIYADGDYNDEEQQIVTDLRSEFGFTAAAYEDFRSWVIRMDQLKIEGVQLILTK